MTPSCVPASLLLVSLVVTARPGPSSPNPEPELGLVRWGRDPGAAISRARNEGRPVLVLFDEVPGCATCVGFGRQVLSHPLLVEAIEREFVPVFVANNRGGSDSAWLRRFGEPAWNNPVVRFLDGRGRDLIERREGLYTPHAIAERLILALRAAGRPVPGYLSIAEEESRRARRAEATFVMPCFWEGEARLGAVPGVLDVRAVHTDRGEGVRVTWDASRLPAAALEREAGALGCELHAAATGRERTADGSDHLRALARSPLRNLELTPLQAVRVNSALSLGRDPATWLTPSQREQARLARRSAPADPASGVRPR